MNNGFISIIALILGGQAVTTSTAEAVEQLSPYSALPNLALICDRGSKVSPISNLFVTNMLCHLHVNGSGSYAFLLYRLGSK
ncbi:DNA methyltransferase [Helicobacter pylori]|uniref:DNA methyltransferase n=1 Tax=Helicobacter pylori TaxID=210 RepID=UPI001E5D981B|nr:DNA methyltransferase [Helicobacter pylori]